MKKISQLISIFQLFIFKVIIPHAQVDSWQGIQVVSPPTGYTGFLSLAYGNGYYGLVGNVMNAPVIYRSTDLLNWTDVSNQFPFSASPSDLEFVDGNFWLAINGMIYTSPEMLGWTYHATTNVFQARNIRRFPDLYFVGGENTFAVSADGLQWSNPMSDADFLDMAFGNGTYVLVGRKAGKGIIYTSGDGFSFTPVITEADNKDMFYSVDFAQNMFVVTGNNGIVGTSADGANWNFNYPVGNMLTLRCVRYMLNHWVANSPSNIYYSSNGSDWSAASKSGFSVSFLMKSSSYNGMGFIPGDDGYYRTQQPVSLFPSNLSADIHISVYPNPFRELLHISSFADSRTSTSLLDASGRCITQLEILPGESVLQIDFSALPAGLYTLKSENDAGVAWVKLIKHY
jgi:hypothetical protein